jgi:hypothetical protein
MTPSAGCSPMRLMASRQHTALLAQSSPGVQVSAVGIGDIVSGASTKAFLDITYVPGGNPGNLPDSLVLKGGFEDYSERTAPRRRVPGPAPRR